MNTKNFLKEHAVYQIYPISFKDGNGDGIGDLQGIISKLDYLKDLGIKIVWLSPIYKSPMFDMGYDISDYRSINPMFGTMEDFEELIKEAEKRGIKILMDLVVNHTSDQHPWFQEALHNPNSKYRKYYIFMQGKKDKKGNWTYPNNWQSSFTGPAWEPVPGEEGMYYLHLFSKQQPDLNWHNPEVLKEVEDILTYWMDKGVYGFRCDVISEIYKDSFEDGAKSKNPVFPVGTEHYTATEGNHNILKAFQRDVIEPRGGVLIGECGGPITTKDAQKFLDHELDTFFEFDIANLNNSYFTWHCKPRDFKDVIIKWQTEVDWNGNYLENHDQHRVFTRYVYGKDEIAGAKMLLTLQYTLRGTPFIYMGQEFGAHDYPEPLPLEECHDCVTKAVYDIARGYHLPKKTALKIGHHFGRDDERAPMAFDDSEGYGFSEPGVKPWQVYNPTGKTYNAKSALADPDSILNFFKKINAYRENNPVLTYGDIKFHKTSDNVLAYTRDYENERRLIILNLTGKKQPMPEDVTSLKNKELVISNYKDTSDTLRPYEALVFRF